MISFPPRVHIFVMRVFSVLFFLAFVLILTNGTALAASECFSCHEAKSFAGKLRHQPFADGNCSTCHAVHASRHNALLLKQEKELCLACHPKVMNSTSSTNSHGPIQEGKCTPCHNPHASDQKRLLRAPINQTCILCHPADQTAKYQHQPFAKGNCDACHQPHQSEYEHLLNRIGDSLCYGCHETNAIAGRHTKFPMPVANCLSCHDPHGSSQPGMLRNVLHPPFTEGCDSCHQGSETPATAVCLSCHDEMVEQSQALHNHILPMGTGNTCTRCHTPHASSGPKLLKRELKALCMSCHETVRDRLTNRVSVHSGNLLCTSCHLPHGSDRPAMLKADGNALCSQCHETQGTFSHPVGPAVIDPRNRQPMTCLTCHDSKGSDHTNTLLLDGERDLCVQCHRY